MKKAAKEYIDDKNWYKDRYQSVLLQRKILTLITLLSILCTLGTVLVIARLTPLKTVEPFVIQVDQKTGITQAVDPLSVPELTANEAVNNFFLVQYIRAREGYSASEVVANYDRVRIMSESAKVYPEFRASAEPNNPESHAARLGSAGVRTVKISSISYLSSGTAQVHMLVEENGPNIGYSQRHKIATIDFQYVKLTLNSEERHVNPLGFRVTSYRVDDEDIVRK